jgi:alpha-1,6-mannosyltransferase
MHTPLDRAFVAHVGGSGSLASRPLPPPLRPGALCILDITEFFGETSGGVRTYLLRKAAHIAEHHAFRQVLIVPGPVDQVAERDGVRCYRLRGPSIPTRKPYRFMVAPHTTRRILRHERPDLVEIGSSWAAPWLVRGPLRELGTPAVWFCHDAFARVIAPTSTESRLRRAASQAAWRYVRAIARQCRAVLAPSDFVARDLECHGVGPVVRVSLGVDVERFHPSRRHDAARVYARYGLPDRPLVMFAGRFAPEKRLDTLLLAWPEIERRTGAQLVLVGEGPDRQRLRSLDRGNAITWLPFEPDRDRLADLLAAAAVYVSPSPVETFGLAAVEALASGTPVVTADQGGVAETVVRSGAGTTFPVGDPMELAEATSALLHEGHDALGRLGRAYVEAHHSWPVVLDHLLQLYRELARS